MGIREVEIKMGRVIYAFPGTGKTTLCNINKSCIELASEDFHWEIFVKSENNKGIYTVVNKDWPINYLNAIIKATHEYNYVFVTHSGSVLCRKNGIPYDIVYPSLSCKEEYINRMKSRGNNEYFVKNMQLNFDFYIESCKNDDFASEKIELSNGQFLSDAMKKLDELNRSPLFDELSKDGRLITPCNSSNEYVIKTKTELHNNEVTYALIVFDGNYIDNLIEKGAGKEVGRFYSGSNFSKIVLMEDFIITNSFLGGPNASGLMEELVSYGIRYFLSVGTACNIGNKCGPMLVEKAIRDEGTSIHYKRPSLYAYTSKSFNTLIENELNNLNVEFYKGITWTTDAYYMETLDRLNKRIKQGATSIDMESAAWCAVAEYLKVDFSQLLFFKDRILNNGWDKNLHNDNINDGIIDFGVGISRKLSKKVGKKNEY